MNGQTFTLENLSEEEMSIIVSSLIRELHLVDKTKLYKSHLIREIIEKVNRADRPRRAGKLD